jgi:hypothetical protein
MRILPFPIRRTNKAENGAHDWSQDEIADFYRAHRLLVENGAGIGIDRGISDIGDPWMVFFDGASQDVFLHVARIDNRCHLICDSLDLRLSAANINQLISEFENSVRELLSIRAERSKNVVIHPAARIIMSISAIFLLFKLESGEAQAKGLHEKSQGGVETGSGRLNDKISAAMVRAQTAFGRVFESNDTPGHVALLAGAIIALELSRSNIHSANNKTSEQKEDIFIEFQKTDTPVLETNTHISKPDNEDIRDKYQNKTNLQSYSVSEYVDMEVVFDQNPRIVNIGSLTWKATESLESTESNLEFEQNFIPNEGEDNVAQVNQSKTSAAKISDSEPRASVFDDEAQNALKEFIAVANGNERIISIEEFNNFIKNNNNIEINLDNLQYLDQKLGLEITTTYEDYKMFMLIQYFANTMEEYDFEYVTGKVLIEEKDVELLSSQEIGIWTNVMSDGSTFSIVGHVGLIDDVSTFFA